MQNERVGGVLTAVLLVLAAGCSDSGSGDTGSAAKHRDASTASQADGGSGDAGAPADPCPHGKLDDSYTIMTDEDAAAVAACTEISKDLTVSGDAVTKLSLPKLKAIGGALNVSNATALTRFELSSLTAIAKELTVDSNTLLSAFSLPALESTGTLLIVQNPKLTDFDLDALTTSDFVGLKGNDALTIFDLPQLESIGVLTITVNAALATVSMDSLTTVSADGFIITKNPRLSTLSMPMLTMLEGDIIVQDNPMLPSCQIDAIAAQFQGPPVPVSAFGNDDSATCP